MRYVGKLQCLVTIGVSNLLLATILLTGCDVSNVEMSLDGPTSVAKSGTAQYTVTTTGLTPTGIVEYVAYIDLNGDQFIDDGEVFAVGDVGIDADGVAVVQFSLQPATFFGDRKLAVPSTTTVLVGEGVWWVDREQTWTYIDTVSKNLAITNR